MADKPLPAFFAGVTKKGYAVSKTPQLYYYFTISANISLQENYEEESEKVDPAKHKRPKNKRN
jgi:hypothetical protein